jgi:type III secretion system FlhB-like substrate exporter
MTQKNQENRQVFAIRLSPTERQKIEAKADHAGMKLSEYLRATALKQKIPRSVPKINREIYIELGRIGNNINQIAKAANIAIKRGDKLNVELLQLLLLDEHLDKVRLQVLAISDEQVDDENS